MRDLKISLYSFFSGIGLLDLGFEDEDYNVVFVNEIHEPFLNAYRFGRIGRKDPFFGYDKSNTIDFLQGSLKRRLKSMVDKSRRKGDIVGFIGGPPCPDFSVAGKNLGINGKNGILSQVYFELINQFKPDLFFFENVRGLWGTKQHRAFYNRLKYAFSSAGYMTADSLINAIQYGTPQNRERILLLGVTKSIVKDLGLEIVPDKNDLLNESYLCVNWDKYAKYRKNIIFEYPWPKVSEFCTDSNLLPPPNIPLELTVEHWFRSNDVTNHPNSGDFFKPRKGLPRFLSVKEGDDRGKSFKRLHRWRYSPTAAYGHNEVHLHPYKPRRLSVAESLAIQSMPPNFCLPSSMSLTDMFQGVGNGVPYLAARSVAKSIKDLFVRL